MCVCVFTKRTARMKEKVFLFAYARKSSPEELVGLLFQIVKHLTEFDLQNLLLV